jgi:hypothetical protein
MNVWSSREQERDQCKGNAKLTTEKAQFILTLLLVRYMYALHNGSKHFKVILNAMEYTVQYVS